MGSAEKNEAMSKSVYQVFNKVDLYNLLASDSFSWSVSEVTEDCAYEGDTVALQEIKDVYLPLVSLLNFHIGSSENKNGSVTTLLDCISSGVPYIIGVVGSVAVGKSTVARILQNLLAKYYRNSRVEIVSTDGFLYSNEVLEKLGLRSRKGFPETFQSNVFLEFIHMLKTGKFELKIPIYSHDTYDIIPNAFQEIKQPDIVIVEGVNVLQKDINISNYLDFTIYIDADTKYIKEWFLQRFMKLREYARETPEALFYKYCSMSEEEVIERATDTWDSNNEVNLKENILPFREMADLILQKKADHSIEHVLLRKYNTR